MHLLTCLGSIAQPLEISRGKQACKGAQSKFPALSTAELLRGTVGMLPNLTLQHHVDLAHGPFPFKALT